MNRADWPGSSVVVDPEQVAVGDVKDWQVGPEVSFSPDTDWVSVTPTSVNTTLPVLVTLKS